jgi:hypothetical protein
MKRTGIRNVQGNKVMACLLGPITECSGEQSHCMPSWSDYGMFRETKSWHAFLVRLRNVQGNKVIACLLGPITECSGKQSHGMPSWADFEIILDSESGCVIKSKQVYKNIIVFLYFAVTAVQLTVFK